jgi:hypothetical protein
MYNTAPGMVPVSIPLSEIPKMKKVLVLSAFFAALIGCQQKEAPKAPAAEAPAAAPAAPAAAPANGAAPAAAPAAPATDKK